MDFRFVKNFVDKIVLEFESGDVFSIAEKANVKIVYERWFPVTIGEFDRNNQTICVNLDASEKVEKIIAHELGHFFAADLKISMKEEEIFARLFADLLENKK